MGNKILAGTFAAVGASASIQMEKDFNIFLWGTFSGGAQLERSFDSGVTWVPCNVNAVGGGAAYTAPMSGTVSEPEGGLLYRWNCTAFTSGSINYRISQ
jgi:hypothetical protein